MSPPLPPFEKAQKLILKSETAHVSRGREFRLRSSGLVLMGVVSTWPREVTADEKNINWSMNVFQSTLLHCIKVLDQTCRIKAIHFRFKSNRIFFYLDSVGFRWSFGMAEEVILVLSKVNRAVITDPIGMVAWLSECFCSVQTAQCTAWCARPTAHCPVSWWETDERSRFRQVLFNMWAAACLPTAPSQIQLRVTSLTSYSMQPWGFYSFSLQL